MVFGVASLPGSTVAYAATFSVATLAAVVAAVRAMVRDAVTDSTYERFGSTMDVELDYREH